MIKFVVAVGILYFFFLFLPGIWLFFFEFGRQKSKDFSAVEFKGTQYEPYADAIHEAIADYRRLPFEKVSIKAHDGIKLVGDYADAGGRTTVLFMHGFRASAEANFAAAATDLYREGFNILAADERAHGRSGGRYCGMGLLEQEDLLDWIGYITSRTPDNKIILFGTSMGCTTIEYASDRLDETKVLGMVLDCGFISPYEQTVWESSRRNVPWRLMIWETILCGHIYLHRDIREEVTGSLSRTRTPALFLHGLSDERAPAANGLKCYEACASAKEKIFIENVGHAVMYYADRENILKKIISFTGSPRS